MGWKAVKDHYRISHIVHVVDGQVSIGSPYIPSLICVAADGSLAKRYEHSSNDELHRYQQEMGADPAKLRELLEAADHFDRSIPVYSCTGGALVEQYCEDLGWPNVTHGGQLMYDNSHWPSKVEALRHAIKDGGLTIEWRRKTVEDAQRELAGQQQALADAESHLEQYQEQYLRLHAQDTLGSPRTT